MAGDPMAATIDGRSHRRWMASARTRSAVTGTVMVLLVVGCTSKGITLRHSNDLQPCAVTESVEPVTIPVEDLSNYSECDLTGVWLLYPTGDTRQVGAPAVTSGGDASDFSVIGWTNWGPDGVSAWRQTDDSVTIWGTPAGVQLSVRAMDQDGRAEGSPARPTGTSTP